MKERDWHLKSNTNFPIYGIDNWASEWDTGLSEFQYWKFKLLSKRQSSCCFRCSANTHIGENCPFKQKECFFCKIRGHSIKKCKKRARAEKNRNSSRPDINQLNTNAQQSEIDHHESQLDDNYQIYSLFTNEPWKFDGEERPKFDDDYRHYLLFKTDSNRGSPTLIKLSINETSTETELDTGAALSVISIKTLKSKLEENYQVRSFRRKLSSSFV